MSLNIQHIDLETAVWNNKIRILWTIHFIQCTVHNEFISIRCNYKNCRN